MSTINTVMSLIEVLRGIDAIDTDLLRNRVCKMVNQNGNVMCEEHGSIWRLQVAVTGMLISKARSFQECPSCPAAIFVNPFFA